MLLQLSYVVLSYFYSWPTVPNSLTEVYTRSADIGKHGAVCIGVVVICGSRSWSASLPDKGGTNAKGA